MTIVVDASAVVTALIDDGPDGDWAAATLRTESLAAPHLMPVEAENQPQQRPHVPIVFGHEDLHAGDAPAPPIPCRRDEHPDPLTRESLWLAHH